MVFRSLHGGAHSRRHPGVKLRTRGPLPPSRERTPASDSVLVSSLAWGGPAAQSAHLPENHSSVSPAAATAARSMATVECAESMGIFKFFKFSVHF